LENKATSYLKEQLMRLIDKPQWDAIGKLLVRITIAGLMLFHGIAKIRTGVDMLGGMLQGRGIPEFVKYGVFVGEIVAPVFILIGFWTRTAALVLAFNMAFAVWLVHSGDFLKLQDQSGAWALELQGWYFFISLAIFFMGPGKYSIDGCLWRSEVPPAQPPVAPPAR
jgi:putative oxidoreductase